MTKFKLAVIIIAGLLFNASSLLAQDSDETQDNNNQDGDTQIMELVEVKASASYRVNTASSATGLNVPLDELPVTIQVISSEVVSDFNLLSHREALQFSSSIDDKRVRGFNSGEFFRNGFIYLSDTPGYTIERMEILMGPSAVLNGPVTPGGAVNIITKKPMAGENFGDFNGFWGSSDGRNNYGVNLDVNVGELGQRSDGSSMASLRLVGGTQTEEGYGTAVDNDNYAVVPMIQFRPTDTTVIDFEYNKYKISSDRTDRPMAIELTLPGATAGEEVPLALAYGIDPRASWFGQDTDIDETVDDFTIGLKQQLGDNFLLQLGYNDHNRDFKFGPGNRPRVDIFYRMVANEGAPAGSTNPNDYRLRRLTERLSLENEIKQTTAALTWIPDWGGSSSHQFNFGVNFYDQDAHLTIARPREATATGGFYFDWFNPFEWNPNNLGFNQDGANLNFITVLDRLEAIDLTNYFINWHASLMDGRLNVLLGYVDSEISIDRNNLRADNPAWVNIADNSESLLQAGAVFAINEMISVYGNYSESQLPDVNDPDFNTTPPVRLGEQTEFGMRFSFLDGALTTRVSYFQIDEELFGETERKASSDGWEVAGFWIPSDNLELSFNYTHLDTEVTASSVPERVGDPLVDEVPNKASFWGRYNFDGNLQGLAIGGGYIWTGERVRPTAAAAQSVKKLNGQVLRYDPESRLDLFASYDWNDWQFALNLRNLTKEVNLSNTVPRVPLQGGVKADGSPYTFDGEMEIMLTMNFSY